MRTKDRRKAGSLDLVEPSGASNEFAFRAEPEAHAPPGEIADRPGLQIPANFETQTRKATLQFVQRDGRSN
jgi:hypothetical protein